MSLSIPRKRKLIRIIIIVSSLVDADLDNEVEGTVIEILSSQLAHFHHAMYSSVERLWSAEQQDLWDAFEAIDAATQPGAPFPTDWQLLSDNLGAKLAAL